MSPVALGLDLLLAGLLVAALAVGVRLNARLRTLRDGQAGFAEAVIQLNQAAARAEAGLASLRAASEEAHDSLLLRIETARQLSGRLEQATTRAERVSQAGLSPVAMQDDVLASAQPTSRSPSPGIEPPSLSSLADLAASLRPGAGPARTKPDAPPSPTEARPTAAPRRGRAAFDDDLFESGADRLGAALPPSSPRRQKGDPR